ncbi:MAG: hypothetical protein PF484_00620 [Bacteroidales bacterium]|jgi:hypothetical protein|nr:hypothetical protein [Bacteroidales bacterium]
MALINSARELDVYKLAYKAAMEIFYLTKSYPAEEKSEEQGARSKRANWRRGELAKKGEQEIGRAGDRTKNTTS